MIARRSVLRALAASPFILSARASLAVQARFDPAETVRDLVSVTRAEYHDPALSAVIADHLVEAMKSGRLDAETPAQLAERLNREIAAASSDAHFVVMAGRVGGMRPVPPTEPHSETEPFDARELAFLQRRNFGIAAAETLDDKVGRLAIDQFFRPAAEIRQQLAVAMRKLASSNGLIVDLTANVGGDPKTVALLMSYFFDRPPFVLNRFRWRTRPVEEFRTTREPGGPLYGEDRPVAVLVSRSSFSAAEEFAYDMQTFRRGVVVGVRTPGAANHALPESLSGGLTAFIPKARAENPVTGTNWEGVGVEPDVAADPPTVADAHRVILARLRT